MIRIVAIAVLAICASGLITGLALTIRQFVRHPGQRHQPRAWADAEPATLTATIPRRDVAGAPPWNPATGWAGDCAPDPETYRDVWAAEHPANVPGTVAETGVVEHFPSARPAVPGTITEEILWLPSGNGPVTVAEPLAPLPPEPKPGPLPASAPAQNATGLASSGSADAPAAATASRTGSTSRTAAPSPAVAAAASTRSPSDALTLLDERQQLIDHAAAVIAAAKFDRILGGVMADA